MKKRLTALWVMAVMTSFIFIVTGSVAKAEQKNPESWPKILTIATLPEGTASYIMAAGLAKQIEDKLGIPVTVTVGGPAEGLRVIGRKEAEFSTPTNTIVFSAVNGTKMFKKDGKLPLQFVTATYPILVHLMAKKGIKSFKDLKGKRCMFDFRGAPYFMTTVDLLLKFHGMTRDDIRIIKMSSPKEVSSGLIAGTIDAGIRAAPPAGSPALKNTAKARDLNFFSLSKAEEEYIREKAPPWLGFYTVAAKTYKGQSEPIRTTGVGKSFVVHRDLPEDLVYQVAKLLMDSAGKNTPGKFAKYHKNLAWTLQDNVDLMRQKLASFHPGVIKYLKERGVWTPDLDNIQRELLAPAK